MKYGIIGTGSAPEKVVHTGLRDAIKDGDEVVLYWTGSPVPSGMEHAYSFILDNEIPFTLLYTDEQKVPGAFKMAENGMAQKVRDVRSSLIKAVDGKVLFLWDDESDENEELINYIFDNSDAEVLELSNGLAPIVMENAPDAPVSDPVEEPENDSTEFTREQLESMTPFAVKQYGARRGCKGATKAAIIEELFEDELVENEAPSEEPSPVVVVDGTSFPSKMPERTSNPNWDQELTILINNFMQFQKPGFETDMAHLALGQARLWMLKALSS